MSSLSIIKLLATTAGRPIKNEDLQLFQQHFEIFKAICDDLGNSTMWLVGGKIYYDGGGYITKIDEGILYAEGELMYFQEWIPQSQIPSDNVYVQKIVTGINPRTHFDSAVKSTSESYTAVYSSSVTSINVADAKHLYDYLNDSNDILSTVKLGLLASTETKRINVFWDMQNDINVDVLHSLGANYVNIKTIQFMIKNNANSILTPAPWFVPIYEINSTQIRMRQDSAEFQTADYSGTAQVRGYLTLTY